MLDDERPGEAGEIGTSTISAIMGGTRNAGPKARRQISEALQIPPAELFKFPGGKK